MKEKNEPEPPLFSFQSSTDHQIVQTPKIIRRIQIPRSSHSIVHTLRTNIASIHRRNKSHRVQSNRTYSAVKSIPIPTNWSNSIPNPFTPQSWQFSRKMAPSMKNSHSSSNCGGEVVSTQANVLASCYIVDSSARLSGFHYSTTGAGGAKWYP